MLDYLLHEQTVLKQTTATSTSKGLDDTTIVSKAEQIFAQAHSSAEHGEVQTMNSADEEEEDEWVGFE